MAPASLYLAAKAMETAPAPAAASLRPLLGAATAGEYAAAQATELTAAQQWAALGSLADAVAAVPTVGPDQSAQAFVASAQVAATNGVEAAHVVSLMQAAAATRPASLTPRAVAVMVRSLEDHRATWCDAARAAMVARHVAEPGGCSSTAPALCAVVKKAPSAPEALAAVERCRVTPGVSVDHTVLCALLRRAGISGDWPLALHLYTSALPQSARTTDVHIAAVAALRRCGRWSDAVCLLQGGDWRDSPHPASSTPADSQLCGAALGHHVASGGFADVRVLRQVLHALSAASRWLDVLQLTVAFDKARVQLPGDVVTAVMMSVPASSRATAAAALVAQLRSRQSDVLMHSVLSTLPHEEGLLPLLDLRCRPPLPPAALPAALRVTRCLLRDGRYSQARRLAVWYADSAATEPDAVTVRQLISDVVPDCP